MACTIDLEPYFKQYGTDHLRYISYRALINWLDNSKMKYSLQWENTGHYYPHTLVIEEPDEDVLAFKLRFLV